MAVAVGERPLLRVHDVVLVPLGVAQRHHAVLAAVHDQHWHRRRERGAHGSELGADLHASSALAPEDVLERVVPAGARQPELVRDAAAAGRLRALQVRLEKVGSAAAPSGKRASHSCSTAVICICAATRGSPPVPILLDGGVGDGTHRACSLAIGKDERCIPVAATTGKRNASLRVALQSRKQRSNRSETSASAETSTSPFSRSSSLAQARCDRANGELGRRRTARVASTVARGPGRRGAPLVPARNRRAWGRAGSASTGRRPGGRRRCTRRTPPSPSPSGRRRRVRAAPAPRGAASCSSPARREAVDVRPRAFDVAQRRTALRVHVVRGRHADGVAEGRAAVAELEDVRVGVVGNGHRRLKVDAAINRDRRRPSRLSERRRRSRRRGSLRAARHVGAASPRPRKGSLPRVAFHLPPGRVAT